MIREILIGVLLTGNIMASDDLTKYKKILGGLESGGESKPYKAVNRLGYLGKYQFGKDALIDLGYRNKKGKWTGKDNIKSKKDFLGNPNVQEKALTDYVKIQKRYLKSKGTLKHIGKTFNGIPITEAGLIGASHLVGAGGVNKMLNTGNIPKDANETKATKYLKMLADTIFPGAEGAEINEENMAKEKMIKGSGSFPKSTLSKNVKGMKSPGIAPKEGSIFENISRQMNKQGFGQEDIDSPTPPSQEREIKKEEEGRTQLHQEVRPDPNKQDSTMSQFKQALTYLGPRFIAQLIGGNEAMSQTDAILKDVDKFQMAHAEQQMTPFEKEKIRIEDDKIKVQRGQIGAQQLKSIEKRQEKHEAESTELSRMTATMDLYDKSMKDLLSGLDFVGAEHFAPGASYESVLASLGGEEGIALQRLKEIQLAEVMKAVALTKGAVSDKEMALFAKRAPAFSANKQGWISWIAEKGEAMEKVRYRVEHKLDYRNKKDQKELEEHMNQYKVSQQQKFYGNSQQEQIPDNMMEIANRHGLE